HSGPGAAAQAGAWEMCPHSFDVLHYNLNFDTVDASTTTLGGHTVIDLVARENALASIDLDLSSQLAVSAVELVPGGPLGFTHAADVLTVQFGGAAPDSGDTVSVDVTYAGTPENEGAGGFGGFWFTTLPNQGYSMGIGLNADPPSMAWTWFPCYDWPCDKATVSLSATTNLNRTVVSNGLLVGTDSTATERTWHWAHDYPISPYLIAMSVARYNTVADSIVTDPRITAYHIPSLGDEAPISFQFLDLMMEALEFRFGPYPFDKFAFMTAQKGDMEHQTCVTHASTLVDGTNNYDDILSHEMTHMWFGDCVTYGDWRDIWLSEGFASYGEAVYREYKNGLGDYHWYVTNALFGRVFASGVIDGLYDPPVKWGVVNYEKGGSVLHMLRGVLDDDALFFQALRDFLAAHAYSNAVTTDFIDSVNATVGQDLSWFFDPWVYGEGHPVYEYGWASTDLGGGQYRVDAVIRQVQTTASLFDLPIDFRVTTTSGTFDFSEPIAAAVENVSFVVTGQPTAFEVDPDDWVLDVQQLAPTSVDFSPEVAAAQSLRMEIPRPNPFRERSEIRYYVPSAGRVRISVHDVAGRLVRALDDRVEQAGPSAITWDRRDDGGAKVAAGVYLVRLEAAGRRLSSKLIAVD
ncbi:T9SS type A sorting domain-containing protein, partial [bacterium]|nr:T9SS type A sorting domain-containing protein [bacterium]